MHDSYLLWFVCVREFKPFSCVLKSKHPGEMGDLQVYISGLLACSFMYICYGVNILEEEEIEKEKKGGYSVLIL